MSTGCDGSVGCSIGEVDFDAMQLMSCKQSVALQQQVGGHA